MIALIVSKPTKTCGPRGTKRKENVGATIMKITAESLVSKTAPMIIVLTTKQAATEGAIEEGTISPKTHHTEDLSLITINRIRIGVIKITEGTLRMIIPIADSAPR
jgi:hypothetical protein